MHFPTPTVGYRTVMQTPPYTTTPKNMFPYRLAIGLPFSFPALLALFCFTCISATVYALVTQVAPETVESNVNTKTASDTSVTPEVLARTSFAIRTTPEIPSAFTGTLMSLTDSHALIAYHEPAPATFENPENGTSETIHQSTYVVTNITPQTTFSPSPDSFETNTEVSVHIQTEKTNPGNEITYTLSHMQPAPQKSGA